LKLWKYLPPEWGHRYAPQALKLYVQLQKKGNIFPFSLLDHTSHTDLYRWEERIYSRSSQRLFFKNPLGVAGGLDKNGLMVSSLFHIGFGFVEVGTVTPKPQTPNSGVILDRSWDKKILWNKMGFPSEGMVRVKESLKSFQLQKERALLGSELGPVWVNVGKNRNTPNEEALQDYSEVISFLESVSDGFVINISSPNTQHLRDLQKSQHFRPFLQGLRRVTEKPLLLKVAPDHSEEDLKEVLNQGLAQGLDGFILTNTTSSRLPEFGNRWPLDGGLSGSAVAELSKKALNTAVQVKKNHSGQSCLLVSVGGVLTPQDVKHRLDLGADLVQVYSALVFEGFSFPKNVSHYFNGRKNGEF
jgi:dihydroorotate dehydrogenase